MSELPTGQNKVAIIGAGVIGAGWAARFLLHGWDVAVFDPHPDTRRRVDAVLGNARKSLPALVDAPLPAAGTLQHFDDLAAAVADADWIQESVAENLDTKLAVLADVQSRARSDATIGSSTSGFRPSQLQQGSGNPSQILVAHPFNPVYLLPLVEVVAGPAGDPARTEAAAELLRSIGMAPVLVRNEIDAHLADRLLEAVWREALWLIDDDIATTREIDDVIRFGFGLRWAQMGLFETYRLAGGEEGMAHFLRQFGPCLEWPWTKLTDVPELDEQLVQKIAEQSDAQSGGYSIRELESIRDRNLVGVLRVLKERDWGAGRVLNEFDKSLRAEAVDVAGHEAPLRLLELSVLPAWIDYNGHMTEFRYVQVFSDSCEALLRRVGMHDDYVTAGNSWYTAETHNQFIDEVAVDEPMYTTAQVLFTDGKRLHVFYRLHASSDDRLLATLEAMYLHVDTATGRVVAATDDAMQALTRLAANHAGLDKPDAAGRYVGQR